MNRPTLTYCAERLITMINSQTRNTLSINADMEAASSTTKDKFSI
ncbi:Unknown protein sequence [Pseudomonas amygdali pv. morsprunorum]|nr:Unknown protein sequence [Pseudomonas amygdali pv. morsprunorum]